MRAKTKPSITVAPTVALPNHIQLTEHETALVARFDPPDAQQSCMLRFLIEYRLFLDASEPNDGMSKISNELCWSLENLRNWTSFLRDMKDHCPQLANYSGLTSVDELGYIEADEDDFLTLVELCRREYLEPPAPRQVPLGHLAEQDDDDD